MQLTAILLAALTAVFSVTATAEVSSSSSESTTAATTASKPFHLKTKLINPKKNKQFDNLYVYTESLDRSTNDVGLSSFKPVYASVLDNGTVTFNLTSPGGGKKATWGLVNTDPVPYTGWQPVQINKGLPDPASSAFSINETAGTLQWTSAPGTNTTGQFGGWRVCNWWHGGEQLFWVVKYYAVPAPGSCSDVDLVVEYN